MKTEFIIKSLQAKQNKINRKIALAEKDIEKIVKVEEPTKEQMKEAVLLFGGIGRYKKVYNEIQAVIDSIVNLDKYDINNL